MNRPAALSQFEQMSLEDFEELLLDKPEDEKWELIGGRVIRGMVGARWEHKRIIQNITVAMMNHFRAKGSPCRPFDETFWLKEKSLELGVFPDVMVRRGPLSPGAIHLSDPVVIIEVISQGSEARDRIEKWGLYQKLPSVKHYALVSRHQMHVEVFDRTGEDWSGLHVLDAPKDTMRLPAVDFEIPLAEIYRDVFAGA